MTYKQTPTGILLPPSFAESAPSKPIFDEVATTSNGRDITRGYVDSLALLPPTDAIQQLRGRDLSVYDEVRRDDQVQTALQQRKLALSGKEWEVKAGGKLAIDKKAADFITEQLGNIDFDRLTEKMLSGLFWGYAVAEALWATDGNSIVLADIKVKKQKRFGFAPDGSLRLLTSSHPLGEAIPARKFWAFSLGSDDDDDLYGLGLAHYLYWPTFFKRNGIKFWLIFLEKFGMPTAVGKYPLGASEAEKTRLLQALSAIQSDSGVRIPESMSIDLIEAARSGTADYTALYDRMNAAISKVILGHTGTTDSTPGKLGSEDIAKSVREDLTAADGDLVCSSFNRTIVKWMVEWNFPGAALPKVWRECGTPENLKARAERDKIVFDMGFKPTLAHVTDTYDGEFVEINPPAPVTDTTTASTVAAFAESAPITQITALIPDPVTDYTNQLADLAATQLQNWLDIINSMLNSSASLEEFRDKLINAYGDLPSEQMAEVMDLAFSCANLSGRYAVSRGS